ncbi:MAG: hypothetical protein A2087_12215 [Spirochaetes bacterium GWD1_61_31]|nr:MAG: hypothetical protein A2Y37_04760 [Spirochaetes bacterium GWB1_60_80]OHD34797.1 MAG: hypothetical protein A2004_08760 [Spirochaetes bacterium GWC1_61_12]OHD35547.1 MAG: hypothetical protein A2087_12215 [Spirochaetes bacterium GWD1_61_31]OHD57924.1 MAG: hypothetical protein A2Y32_03925 [Spirochaetes bacterium GWF1_60_12]HAX37894.1 hypothetical protein [Spirochaetaceae bacterium]
MAKIACAGNALLDINAFVRAEYVQRCGFAPGSTNHVDHASLMALLPDLADAFRTAGGGAANTARVLSALGQVSVFAGSIGDDAAADFYQANLSAAGVTAFLQRQAGLTGVFCALIDEQGQRTIVVCPGIASGLQVNRLPAAFFEGASVLHVDGFLAARPDTLLALIQTAHGRGLRISFDVGGRRVTEQNRDLFAALIRDYCTWVFMNEDEFQALAGGPVDTTLPAFAASMRASIIVKRGQAGAVCLRGGEVIESPVRAIKPLDATGAGDAFAAGFLHAILETYPLARAMRFANRVAEHAIQVPGMRIDPALLHTLPGLLL